MVDAIDSLQDIMQMLSPEEQEELKENLTIQQFKKNETLYQEGEVPQMFHCLLSGKVKIYKDGIGGRTQIVRVIKPVEYFGYRAYFANQNYVTSAAAFETSTVCLIPIEMMERWIMENNQLALCWQFRPTHRQPNSEAHTWASCRIPYLSSRQLWFGRRWCHSVHLFISRRPGQYVQHDHIECHSHLVSIRTRKDYCHRR